MIGPASDELIEHIEASRTPPTSVETAALIARIRQQAAEIKRLHLGDEKRVRHISQLITERDEARDEVERLRTAVNGLLSCPAITEGDIHDPEWGCEESAEAESFARAALKGGES